MPKVLKVSQHPQLDPTLPKTELKIGKTTYLLAFTFKALLVAKAGLREIGVEVNLLRSFDFTDFDADKFVPVLYAALITHHPKITPAEVTELVQFEHLEAIFAAIVHAWVAARPATSEEDVKEDPTPAE